MAFVIDDLLLSPAKQAELTAALANAGVVAPLQYFCDEAAAAVARFTTGYTVDALSLRGLIRSVALFDIYAKANVPAPLDTKDSYDNAMKELEAIAKGERPNLPKTAAAALGSKAGTGSSKTYIPGRMEP